MKLKQICKPVIKFVIENGIYDSFQYEVFVAYMALRKIILHNSNLSELDARQISEIEPITKYNGVIGYRVNLFDGLSRYIYLDYDSEDYYLNAIPAAMDRIFGSNVINDAFYNKHYNMYWN